MWVGGNININLNINWRTLMYTTDMTHDEVVNTIAATGTDVTYIITGEPGIGKSDLLKRLASTLPSYQPIYVDCPTMDIPDIQLPFVEAGTSRFATNAMWGGDNTRPKLIMLDELPKSSNVTRLLFTRLLLDHVIGAYTLPEGSIVFATGNRTQDGVGDVFPAHMNNRVGTLPLAKPTAEQWLLWAENNGIDPVVRAFVNQFPHTMEPAGSPQNPYVFDPKTRTDKFVSPRSLSKASVVISKRSTLGRSSTTKAVAGILGASAAADLSAYLDLADQLPSWQSIMATPDKATVPTATPAQLMIAYGMSDKVRGVPTKDLAPIVETLVTYGNRMHLEVAAVAFIGMLRANVMCATNKKFQQWAGDNQWAMK
jgi:energy-coupling factor transporter ATP-binding protein EcfA2